MNAIAVDREDAPAPPAPQRARSAAAPIYVVCSPNRRVGKTMVARLLAEHYAADARPFAAFDLSDEAPGLADFLTYHVTIPNIHDIRGQVRFFDGLIEPGNVPKIIDLSRREFANFFTIADKFGLFEEARRRAIEPLILFLIDPTPVAAKAYSLLGRCFAGTSLLPVRNLTVAKGLRYGACSPHASRLAVSLEIAARACRNSGPRAREVLFVESQQAGVAVFGDVGPHARRARSLVPAGPIAVSRNREIELSLIREQILTALHSDLLA